MKKIFALSLLLVPATGLARDHDPLAAMGMVILLAIGGVVWFICAAIFKAVFGKKSVESTTAPPSTDDVKPEGK